MSYTVPSDSHNVGDTGETTDLDHEVDVVGALIVICGQLYQLTMATPVGNANNQNNMNTLAAEVGSTTTALLSTQLAAANGVASLDSNGLVPTAQLPISTQSLVLAGAGTPSSALGENGDTYINQSTGQEYAKASGAWGQGSMVYWGQLATTGLSGVALTATAGTIITWTAPNDGLMHRIIPIGQLVVGSAETGGAITFSVTDPTNTLRHPSLSTAWANGGQAAGNYYAAASPYLVYPGTTVSVTYAALTVGTATVYLELWGS